MKACSISARSNAQALVLRLAGFRQSQDLAAAILRVIPALQQAELYEPFDTLSRQLVGFIQRFRDIRQRYLVHFSDEQGAGDRPCRDRNLRIPQQVVALVGDEIHQPQELVGHERAFQRVLVSEIHCCHGAYLNTQ